MTLTNFAEETITVLHRHSYNMYDIAWIGNHDYTVPIQEFFDVALRTNYNKKAYGSPLAIPADLLIVMKDGSHFERKEYDGSEEWKYVPVVKRPNKQAHFNCKSFADVDIEYHIPSLKYYVI